ncbi:MAG: hypothetical protein ACI33N_04810 [Desulfovibrionaceae bacterium]|nr:hypothetical protein [Desulfovibrionaceae bacterium]
MTVCPFFKFSPSGNVTILLPAQALPAAARAAAAREMIAPVHLQAEQVGYVDMDARRLDMAGGEFCVNATRAFGALLAHARGAAELEADVSVSGMPAPVHVHARGACPEWQVTATLLLPHLPVCEELAPGLTLVRVPGINHLLLDERLHPFPADWTAGAAALRTRWRLEEPGAAGCIWWRESPEGLRMTPVVWVAEPGSTFLETACGSGSLACACGLSQLRQRAEKKEVAILQPGGTALYVRLRKNAHDWHVDVRGTVRLIAEGSVYLEGTA